MATDKKLSSLVINTLTQAQYDSATKNEDELYLTPDDTDEQLANKQDKLVSGTNIKTINGNSLLGSGNIEISGGSGDSSVGTITLTDEQAYNLINNNSATLTSENLEVIKTSKIVDIKYNSMTLITLTVSSMIAPSSITSTPIYIYHAYAIIWILANYPVMERILFDSEMTTAELELENIPIMISNSTKLNNRSFIESGDDIVGPQFYEHNIYMLYESGDTTFCIRFAFVNNVSDTYTSVSALQEYLGTNFVKGCSGYMTSSAGYGNAYSVTYNKVTGIVGTSQASITYSDTGLTITDTIKEMS